MGLETGTSIRDFNPSWPTASDPAGEGDDHLQLIKQILQDQFPTIDLPVTTTTDELNTLVGVNTASSVQAQLDVLTAAVAGVLGFAVGDFKFSAVVPAVGVWLPCDGADVVRATYPDLDAIYDAAGYPFGSGDGSTTMGVPDFRGRGPTGTGTGDAGTATAVALGDKRGDETHALTGAENGPHTHTAPSQAADAVGSQNGPQPRASTATASTGSSGSGTPHNIISPEIGVLFFVLAATA